MVDQQSPKIFGRGELIVEKKQTGDLLLEIGSEIEQIIKKAVTDLVDSIYTKLPDDALPHEAVLSLLKTIKEYGFNSEVNLLVAKRTFLKLIADLETPSLVQISKALTDIYFVYGDPYLEMIEIVNERLSLYRAYKEF